MRFAIRLLFKNPGFSLVAILSLALGIGANTAIFSLIDSVMLRMLPVSHPEELYFVNTNAVQTGSVRISRSITSPSLKLMQEQAKTLSSITAFDNEGKMSVVVNGQSEIAAGAFVVGNYAATLGVGTILGRAIVPADDNPDGRVAMLEYAYWQKRFGGDVNVIGAPITVNNVPFTIVGVMPREFYGLSADTPAEVMLPWQTSRQVRAGRMSSDAPARDASPSTFIARIKAGVDVRQAATEMTGLFRQASMGEPGNEAQREIYAKAWLELSPAGQGFSRARNQFSEPLKVLMVVVGVVMLIACANIANLLLAKASARQREIAIRLSLGSTRARLVRQLMTESLLLAFLGGALGIGIAAWARDGIIYYAGTQAGATIPGGWNLRVLGFTAGICLLNALLFGIAPALRATRVDFAESMKSGRAGRIGRLPLARVLVALQVSLSLALLVGAGLFLGTFRSLDRVTLGYDRDHSLMLTVDPALAGYKGAQGCELYRQILERVGAVPGVRSASLMQSRLMSGRIMMNSIFVPGYTLQKGEDAKNLWVITNAVGARFFAISGMYLAAGRDFGEADNQTGGKVAIINETMAKHFFGAGEAVGRTLAWDREEKPMTVIGVVRDFKIFGMQEGKQDAIFTPYLQADAVGASTILVRTALDPSRVTADVREAIRGVDAKLPLFDVITMERQVENSLSQQRLLAMLATAFGILALGLAAIGLYGVLSYGVTQRTGEIGVRMALGAQRSGIVKLILGETAQIVAVGLGIGVGIALLGGRAIKSMLYGVTATDGWSLGLGIAILTGAALIAGFLPARRASKVDPMVALRHE